MQTIVDNWNQSTEEVCKKYDNVYFVPVNDLLYKGIDGKGGVTSSDDSSQSSKSSQDSLNDALLRMIIFIQIIQVIKLCQMPF